ncbi:hypothetical protein IJ096_00755 [Candidatus Saccharibacteria bacterium]|nr:hypothetical protein [Candidatus Saccharibacteria bacterium]
MDIKKILGNPLVMLMLLTILIALACMALSLVGQRGNDRRLPNVPASNEGVLDSWHALVKPLKAEPGTVLAQENLGSHTVTVSKPMVDEAMQLLMEKQGITLVEVHFQRNTGGRLEPSCPDEPDASAAFYFVNNKDIKYGCTVTWSDQGEDYILLYGVGLVWPKPVVQMAVVCSLENPEEVSTIVIGDYFGGQSASQDTNATFTNSSLYSFEFPEGSEL